MPPSDWKRKLTHAGFGLFALALRWLSWPAAAACALAALLANVLLLPKFGKGIYRDRERHLDPGIVAYPAMVLVLILLFRHELYIAAAVWGMMAFGDPAASVVGKLVGGPRIPWNREKTWAGFTAYALVGSLAGAGLFWWTMRTGIPESFVGVWANLGVPMALAGAGVESWKTGLDDNWTTPLPAALVLLVLLRSLQNPVGFAYWFEVHLPPRWGVAAAVNGAVALATGALGVVSVSGAVAGAIVGWGILTFGGWGFYAVLWAFFLLGTVATRLGYAKKKRLGTAQAAGGRRGAKHVLANCGVGLAISFLFRNTAVPLAAAAFAASFAAALADTFGTEFGSLYGKRPYSLSRFKAVAPGTRGAVSAAGTAAALAGALLLALIARGAGLVSTAEAGAVAVAGWLGALAESLLMDLSFRRGHLLDHEFTNAFNTFAGACLGGVFAAWLSLRSAG